MKQQVVIRAPSRLHFGLFRFGNTAGRQFGGVGLMVDGDPPLELKVAPAAELTASGPYAPRVRAFAERWRQFHGISRIAAHLHVATAPGEHQGLGLGTQLGMAVALGLSTIYGLPPQTPQELAISVGRGLRSAVGVYGFCHGGLIVERGKLPGEAVSPLDLQLSLPAAWRVVLVQPRALEGLSSATEVSAFATMPPTPDRVADELIRIAREELAPAAAGGAFASFAASVQRFGRVAGETFAQVQGGPYNGPRAAALVHALVSCGARGVGQSSWGPTLFAMCENDVEARELIASTSQRSEFVDTKVIATRVNRGGAAVSVR